jgi:elongation factor G
MAKHNVEDVRNIALVGHGAAGKTTLADALLFKARAVDRMGSVDDGTSVSDFDDEEHKRHFSIDTSVLHADHQGKRINLLDAPGYPDFVGQALGALNAVETAVIVVSGTNGLEVNTRRMFNEAGKRGLARMLVVNKIDADNVHFADLLKVIQATFGKQCVPLNLPDGVGAAFSGVVSVLNPPAQVPAGCPVDLAAMRSQLIDAVVESDDALMEKYLSEGEVSTEELEKALPKAVSAGTMVPILCTAGKKDKAVAELLDAVVHYAPTPAHTKTRLSQFQVGANGSAKPLEPTEGTEFVGQVFKTLTDKFVGHLSFIRVLSGKIATNQNLFNLRTHKAARVAHLMEMQGKHHHDVPEAVAGDIFAVTKVDGLHIGDTVSTTESAPRLPDLHFPQPMYGLAVEPKNRGDEQKISLSLAKIADEDPTFKITHDAQTHELVITGVSQLHLDVIQHRLKRRFDLEIVTKEPKIPYRETIASEGAGDYRHKKQSGGRGQFGEVHIRIYPLSREIKTEAELLEQFANKSRFEKMRSAHYDPAHNFAFIDHIVGGTIPNQFIPAVKKGCEEMLERGVLAGYRIQDVAVEVYFGKYHDVDSSEAAFKTATRGAFKKAFLSAHPTLMEPVVKLEVTAPSKYTGALLGDLNTKRAHMENQDSLPGDLTVLMCRVPLAEVSRYAAQLGSMTQGQGTYTMEFSHYDLVPANVQQQIVSKAKMVDEDEE